MQGSTMSVFTLDMWTHWKQTDTIDEGQARKTRAHNELSSLAKAWARYMRAQPTVSSPYASSCSTNRELTVCDLILPLDASLWYASSLLQQGLELVPPADLELLPAPIQRDRLATASKLASNTSLKILPLTLELGAWWRKSGQRW